MNVACDYEAPMQMLTTEKYIAAARLSVPARRDTQSWGLRISLHRQLLLHGYTLESDPTLWSRLSIVLEQRNRTSVGYYTATETIQNNTVLEPWNLNLYICT